MNFHNDEWVKQRMDEHMTDAHKYFAKHNIVGLFVQGSTNYGLDTEHSDLDTKLIVTPTFEDIALNHPSISTTFVRDNDEHIDFKDIRLYMQTFRKQNLNFLEILFTPYAWLNPRYKEDWSKLIERREEIARMNPYRAVKSMQGIAMTKFNAISHKFPSKTDIIEKYGYDGKQVHHLLRVADYLKRYVAGEPYVECLTPSANLVELLLDLKNQKVDYDAAMPLAENALAVVNETANKFLEGKKDEENPEVRELLEQVQVDIMRKSVKDEL